MKVCAMILLNSCLFPFGGITTDGWNIYLVGLSGRLKHDLGPNNLK